jgi:N-acetyl-alpha-D-muramate 1-phosphate uridylyltransferase
MSESLSAFFLCAGYGQRLRPLTERIPKPAISFQGMTALEINYRLSKRLYPGRVLCNVHHLWDVMEKSAWKLGLEVLYEKEILGTGGCLDHARHLLETTDHCLIHNADLIHTIDLVELYQAHLASGNIGTLAGIFRSSHNTLSVDQKNRLNGVHGFSPVDLNQEMTRLTFAGIAFYRRDFLRYVSPGSHDIKEDWSRAMQCGETFGIVNCSNDADWYDFGTPQGLWDASRFVMEHAGEFSYGYHPLLAEPRPYVSNEANQDPLPEHLRNVLILEETMQPIAANTHDCILGRNFKWKIQP